MAPRVLTHKLTMLKLDFGCGLAKAAGFEGVDNIAFAGVDHVLDVRKAPWPWADGSVDEGRSSHFVEHLTGPERIVFFNELYRILRPGAKFTLIVPHWSNDAAYGDPTHQWPPLSEWSLMYLSKGWREGIRDDNGNWVQVPNAPHVGYTCDFDSSWIYSVESDVAPDMRKLGMRHYRNVLRDLEATLIRR